MALTRRSKFGFPPNSPAPSAQTVRLVPLTAGVQATAPWPALPPGSATSMTNFLPFSGKLVPRSRISSLNTVATPGTITGLATLWPADHGEPVVWWSIGTIHGILGSAGSISRASFVSAFGLGVSGIVANSGWQYAQTYNADIDKNVLLAVGSASASTILMLYDDGFVRYSYLTSAPQCRSVGAFDNYVIAWDIQQGLVELPTRVQWCVRGNPSNWTSEGSGFEDLLEMKGTGTAVIGTADRRLILFSTKEIWYGLGAAYPSQFQFFPLDPGIGCPYQRTIAETDLGLIFLGSDRNLRMLPVGGGASQVIVPGVNQIVGSQGVFPRENWGYYNPYTRHYYLFVLDADGLYRSIVVNIDTGEWGNLHYDGVGFSKALRAGTTTNRDNTNYSQAEGVFLASTNTIHSTSSLLGTDSGSTVTAVWRSAPIATDLPGSYKQLTEINVDYRATSRSTLTLKISTDGGNNYDETGRALSLSSAPIGNRAVSQLYIGAAFPALEITSTSTGMELHRLDVTLQLGGRR